MIVEVLLMVIELCVVMTTEERILRILCIADPTWDPGVMAPEGFTSELSELSGFDKMELMTVLPRGWNGQECCHRFQIRFNSDTFDGGDVFVPYVEWLPCGLIMTHVSCYGWITDDGKVGGYSGSWWINVHQCIRQDNTDILHDIVTFTDSADSFGSQSSRWKGTLRVGSMAVPSITNKIKLPSKDYVCILDGNITSTALGFKHLKSIEVDWHTSLSFRVEFSFPQPSNQEIFTLHFQTDEQRRVLRDFMKCSNGSMGTSTASIYDEIVSSCLTLPLTASNAWAGCQVDNLEGRPTFTCHGGRNFIVDAGTAKSTVIHIGVSRCSSLHKAVIRLRYRLEFLNPRGPCPGYSVLLERNEAKHSAQGASRAGSIRGDGFLQCVLVLLMSAFKMSD